MEDEKEVVALRRDGRWSMMEIPTDGDKTDFLPRQQFAVGNVARGLLAMWGTVQ